MSTALLNQFLETGWVRFSHDPVLADWVSSVSPVAKQIAEDPDERRRWLRCGGTWFAGVNSLPNTGTGAIPGQNVPGLGGAAVEFAKQELGLGNFDWDRAQLSVCYPGYPKQGIEESDTAFRFRRERDAAHVDGFLRSDPGRRRHIGEAHGFVLGIPLSDVPTDASSLVVWEGSHEMVRAAMRKQLSGVDPAKWGAEDVTDAYTSVRRAIFETCPRRVVHARPGEAYLVHRLALHGVSIWGPGGGNLPRTVAYFRPDPMPGSSPAWWLDLP